MKRSTSSVPREHDAAVYKCKPGFTFKGTAAADRADTTDSDEFHLPCLSTGQFAASPNWPTCTPRCQTYLDAPPAMVTLEPVLPIAYVSPGDKAEYKCSNDDYVVNDNQQFFEVTCGTDGNVVEPGSWPECERRVTCPFAAFPPADSHMQLKDTAMPLKQYEFANYECKYGFTYVPRTGKVWPTTVDVGKFRLICGRDGVLEPHDADVYEVETFPKCVLESSANGNKKRRKKRWVQYNNLYDDIDYTVIAMVEFQFMYTDAIETEVEAFSNLTREDEDFPRALVEKFHVDFEGVLGNGVIKAGLQTTVPFQPICEQPTGAKMQNGKCVPTNGESHAKG